MNLKICGFIDILMIASFVLVVILGYRKGFLTKFLELASCLFGFVAAILLANPFGKFLNSNADFLRKGIYHRIEPNVADKLSSLNGERLDSAVDELGFPDFIDKLIVSGIGDKLVDAETTVSVTNTITKLAIIVIAFIFLFVMFTLGVWFLKHIINLIRESSKTFQVVDGALGIAFNVVLYLCVVYTVFIILSLVLQGTGTASGFGSFIKHDMQLETNKFRISKFFYENNLIGNIFKIFF